MSPPSLQKITRTLAAEVVRGSDDRTLELSFASAAAVERHDGLEVLEISERAINPERLQSGCPVLVDHDPARQVGVVDSWRIASGKARATIRFSRNPAAAEVLQDIKDGIRRNVSVGYTMDEVRQVEINGQRGFKVTRWTPLELSIVSIPADVSVGVGRSLIGAEVMDDNNTTEASPRDIKAERRRVAEIMRLGKQYDAMDQAQRAVEEGLPETEFRKVILEMLGSRNNIQSYVLHDDPPVGRAASVGLYGSDLERYSISRAVRAHLSKDWQDAGLEREVHRTLMGTEGRRAARGILVPVEVFARVARRDVIAGAGGTGQYLVGTDHLADSFIELLRNQSRVIEAGARTLPGLQGNVSIPKHTGAATAYWLAEAGDVTESTPTFGAVTLSPHTVAGRADMTRRMLLQSAPGIDQLIKDDLMRTLGLAIDLAAINGSGSANQPLGILGTSGIGDVAIGANGGSPGWAHMIELMREVSEDNAAMGALAFMTTSGMIAEMRMTAKVSTTDSVMVLEGDTFMGKRVFESNNVPSTLAKVGSSNTGAHHAVIYGNWSDLLIGQWGQAIDLKVDETTLGDSGGLVIRAFADIDIAVRNAQSFAAIQDGVASS